MNLRARDLYDLTHRRFAITRPMTCQIAAWHALVLLILGRIVSPESPRKRGQKKGKHRWCLGVRASFFWFTPSTDMHWELKTFHRAAFCQGMCERSANVPQQHLPVGLCARNVDIKHLTWRSNHQIMALWSPQVGQGILFRGSSGLADLVMMPRPCWLRRTPGADASLDDYIILYWLYCIINIVYNHLKKLYYIIYYIVLIYTLYNWVASHRFCCRTCHVLRHGSKLPSIRRPLLRCLAAQFGSEAETAEVRFCPCRSEDWVLASFMWLT